MNKFLLLYLFFTTTSFAADTLEIDPNQIQIGPLLHDSLPSGLLTRIKALADTFEILDGISYEQSVELYKRDLNPENNIIIYEEMARVYNQFCINRCVMQPERMDVYRLVLLRSMFSSNEVLKRINLSVVTKPEAVRILANYKLEAEPITVIQK